jgi:hypothetical protein
MVATARRMDDKGGILMDEVKINVDEGFLANIDYTPPEYNCPIHGAVTETMIFTYYAEKRQVIFCIRCYEEFLKNHNVTVLEETKIE